MFRTVINTTPLVSEIAEGFFQNIRGENWCNDVTFLSTLRALVAPRMEQHENIYFSVVSSGRTADWVSNHQTSSAIHYIYDPDIYVDGTITVHYFKNARQEDNYACMELMKSSFCNTYDGWERIDKITDFFRKQFYVLCFVNPESKKVVIFTDNLDIRRYHYLQCGIFAFLPWYFDPQKGVSPIEMELIQSLREKTKDRYEACLAKIAEQYDFRTEKIKRLLSGFESIYERKELDTAERNMTRCYSTIEGLQSQLAEQLRIKRDFEIRILGLREKIASESGESEIMDYFLSNKKLSLQEVTDSQMTFVVSDYLTYFDEDMAKSMIGNDRSYIYGYNSISHDDMKALMSAIFLDSKMKIRVCAAFRFRLGERVEAISGYNYGTEFNCFTPNPHLDEYACLGDNLRIINDMVINNNYVGAIEQCVASCKSFNFGDSPVGSEFMSRLYESGRRCNVRCIEIPDGRVLTPKEAIAWLHEQEEESNE